MISLYPYSYHPVLFKSCTVRLPEPRPHPRLLLLPFIPVPHAQHSDFTVFLSFKWVSLGVPVTLLLLSPLCWPCWNACFLFGFLFLFVCGFFVFVFCLLLPPHIGLIFLLPPWLYLSFLVRFSASAFWNIGVLPALTLLIRNHLWGGRSTHPFALCTQVTPSPLSQASDHHRLTKSKRNLSRLLVAWRCSSCGGSLPVCL